MENAQSPDAIPHLFVRYWNKRNARGIAHQFTEDADFVNVTGIWWHTKEDIFQAHDFGLRIIFNHSALHIEHQAVRMLSEQIAIVHAKMKLEGQTAHDVQEAHTRHTIFIFVCHKIDGFWKCVAAQNTDVVPGKQTNLIDENGKLQSVSYKEKR